MSGFSPEDINLISHSDFFKKKNEITHKMQAYLALLGENIAEVLQEYSDRLPHEVFTIAPKISQGERYLDLPWMILDYPRVFSGEDTFAFRSMFWWGNHFSFTIHISNTYLAPLKRTIADNISKLYEKDFYICVNEDQWQHHFEKTNYRKLDGLKESELKKLLNKDFIKLARKIPVEAASSMTDEGIKTYKSFLEII